MINSTGKNKLIILMVFGAMNEGFIEVKKMNGLFFGVQMIGLFLTSVENLFNKLIFYQKNQLQI